MDAGFATKHVAGVLVLICLASASLSCPRSRYEMAFCGQGSMKSSGFYILNANTKQWPAEVMCNALIKRDQFYRSHRMTGGDYDVRATIFSVKNAERHCDKCPEAGLIFNAQDAQNYEFIAYSQSYRSASSRSAEQGSWNKCFHFGKIQDGRVTKDMKKEYCLPGQTKQWTSVKVKLRQKLVFLFVDEKLISMFTSSADRTRRISGVVAKRNVVLFRSNYASVWNGRSSSPILDTIGCGPQTGWITDSELVIQTNNETCLVLSDKWAGRFRGSNYQAWFHVSYPMSDPSRPQYWETEPGIMFNIQDNRNYDFVWLGCIKNCIWRGVDFTVGHSIDGEEIITKNGTMDIRMSEQRYSHENTIRLSLYTNNNSSRLTISLSENGQNVDLMTGQFDTHHPAQGKVGVMMKPADRENNIVMVNGPTINVYH